MGTKRGRPRKKPVVEEQNCTNEGAPPEEKEEAFDNYEGMLFTSAVCDVFYSSVSLRTLSLYC